MTLLQLAGEYRQSAELIAKRIAELRRILSSEELGKTERLHLNSRITALSVIRYDTCSAALAMERYYDKEFPKNAKYTI